MNKVKKKELLKQYKEEQRAKFIDSLPMSIEMFTALFDYLDEADEECKGDLRLTLQFLEEHQCPIEKVVEWLVHHGAGCDCEVLDNIEEQFIVMKMIPEPDIDEGCE